MLLQASEATVRLAGRTAAQLAGGLAAAAAGVASAGGGASAEADAADAERLVFNAESHLPAHGGYVPPGVGLRAMGFLCFVNDKTLLRHLRRDPLYRAFVPVAVRLTHTPFPAALGEAVLAELGHAKRAGAIDEALAAAGAKAARPPSCALNGTHTLTGPELTSSPLAGDVAAVARWSWGGMKPFVLKPDGALATPWGAGTWGLAGDAALFAAFAGATHVLEFPAQPQGQPRNSMFISTRCSDGEEVIGRAVPAPPPAAAR